MADQQEIRKIQQKVGTVIDTERVAEKLSTDTLRTHAEMSIDRTVSDISFIDQVFANRDIVLDDNTKMRLKNARSRAEAHLLVNEHKTLGDSKEMKAVKESVLYIEQLLNAERKEGMTLWDIDALSDAYEQAIKACERYSRKKEPRYQKGKERKRMVIENLSHMMTEASLLAQSRELMRSGLIDGKVSKATELLFQAKLYEISKAKTDKVTTPAPATQGAEGDALIKRLNKVFELEVPKNADEKQLKRYAAESTALRNALKSFTPGKIHVEMISFGGQFIRLTQNEAGVISARFGDKSVDITANVKNILDRVESRMIEHCDLMQSDDIKDIIINQPVEEMGDVIKARTLFARYLELRSGNPATAFNNLHTSALRALAVFVAQGGDAQETVRAIKNMDSDKMINGYETLELLRSTTTREADMTVKVKYAKDDKADDLNGWSEQEAKVRDLVADMIFSHDTWNADETLAEPGERMRRTLLAHKDTIAMLITDAGREDLDAPGMLDKMLEKFPEAVFGGKAEAVRQGIKDAVLMFNKCFDTAFGIADAVGIASKTKAKEHLRDEKKVSADIVKLLEDPEKKLPLTEGTTVNDILCEMEKKIDTSVSDAAGSIQSVVTDAVGRIFVSGPAAAAPAPIGDPEERGITKEERKRRIEAGRERLDQMVADCMRGNSGQGLFIKKCFEKYFTGVSAMDQRNMFASAVRNAAPSAELKTDDPQEVTRQQEIEMGRFLSGMLKGAGPLFQKMLQGLPTAGMPDELKEALEDMKSNLAAIPENIVKAQLLGMIDRSAGKISRIEVDRALGAASVGQTFLCRMYGPDLPAEGKDVVVKLLKPDVRNRMMRERNLMLSCAEETDKSGGMKATYEGQLKRIEEELDLTIEARNVKLGEVYDKAVSKKRQEKGLGDSVTSMKLDELVAPTVNSMVLEKAKGTTLDKYLKNSKKELKELLKPWLQTDDSGEIVVENGLMKLELKDDPQLDDVIEARLKLTEMITSMEKRQEYLCLLANKWVSEGVFKEGFYHGDLHAGNIMIDDDGLTVIDFGNATKMDEDQQVEVTRMVAAAAVGDMEGFRKGLHGLLDPKFESLFKEKYDELGNMLKEVFSLGDLNSSGPRVAVALLKAQEMGLEVPSAIFNFSQCQLRLQNAIDEINEQIIEMRKMSKSMAGLISRPELHKGAADIINPVMDYIGGAVIPFEMALEPGEQLYWNEYSALRDAMMYNDCMEEEIHADRLMKDLNDFERHIYIDFSRVDQKKVHDFCENVRTEWEAIKKAPENTELREAAVKTIKEQSDIVRGRLILGGLPEQLLTFINIAKGNEDDIFEEYISGIEKALERFSEMDKKYREYKAKAGDEKTPKEELKAQRDEFLQLFDPHLKNRRLLNDFNVERLKELRKDDSEAIDKLVAKISSEHEDIGMELTEKYSEYNTALAGYKKDMAEFKRKKEAGEDNSEEYKRLLQYDLTKMEEEILLLINTAVHKDVLNMASAAKDMAEFGEPKNFVGIMCGVIGDNIHESLKRLGFWTSYKYDKKFRQMPVDKNDGE